MTGRRVGADDVAGRTGASGAGTEEAGRRRVVGGRNLPVAIAVGVVLAAVFLGTLFWHPIAFLTVVLALACVAYVEVGRTLRGTGRIVIVPVLVVATATMMIGGYLAGATGRAFGVAVLLLGSILWLLADRERSDVVATLGLTTLFGLWVGLLASYAVPLVDRPEGAAVVLAVVGAAILTDIGGYVFGVAFGRHKVAPSVSPNKTWEGLIGGVLSAVLLGVLVLPWLTERFTPASAALLVGTCGVASFVGDLAESMIKRDLGVKDLGDLLPGHGGILDRVDGILLALPVGFYALVVTA
jgi:phosphatidate cytidylyltransferase